MTRMPFESNTAAFEDKSLIIRIKSGDYEAFTLLYNKYIRPLTQYGLKFIADLPAVEDCLHDVFVWIWTNRHKLSIDYSVKSYLFKSVRTSMLHLLETQNRLSSLHPEQEHAYRFELQLTPEALVLQNENMRMVRQQIEGLLNKLTAKQKEVIYLRYYEGLCFEDISQNMNISVKACYKLMGRAIAILREHIPDSLVLLALLLQLH
jgi:RNA polymerase sigma factor (sigma-70 family)